MSLAALMAVGREVHADAVGTFQGKDLAREPKGDGVQYVLLSGDTHGFDGISLLLSEIQPGGGPPLHLHEVEEVHVVYEGTFTYYVDGRTFTVTAPFVQHIPAKTPHAFINAGTAMVKNTAIFSAHRFDATILGPSPLIQKKRQGM